MSPPHTTQGARSRRGLEHPGRWIWLALLIPIAIGLARLRMDVEIFNLLPTDLPAVQGLKLHQEHFANARELILTLEGKDAETAEAAASLLAERLRGETNLVASVTWEPPWLEHPEQSSELMAYLWLNQAPGDFRKLAERVAPDRLSDTLAAAREELATTLSPQEIARLSYDPLGITRLPDSVEGSVPSFEQGQEAFSSPDGTFRVLYVQARSNLQTYDECSWWLDAIRHKVSAALSQRDGSVPTVTVAYTGRPAFVAEISTGMATDINYSVAGTAGIIALLFWLAHRRLKPMLWLLVLLALILGGTLALGGLVFGTINVISMGFAAILLGLAVDYAVVHYQEALAHPSLSIPEIRSAIAPSIFWAAVTTVAAFLVLNFGGLPGLGQLGTLVGLGVALAAFVMIFEYLPPLFPNRGAGELTIPGKTECNGPSPGPSAYVADPYHRPDFSAFRFNLAVTGVLAAFVALVLVLRGLPSMDSSPDALRPRKSPAYAALADLQAHLTRSREPYWIIVGDRDVSEVARRLQSVESTLTRAVSNQSIAGFTLPVSLWPRPDYQEANRATAEALVSHRAAFHRAAQASGFAERSMALTDRILDTWQAASATNGVFWPDNPMSRWIFDKFTAHTGSNVYALGLVTSLANPARARFEMARVEHELRGDGVWLSSWELLGHSVFEKVRNGLWKVIVPMILLVLVSLSFAFRNLKEILLSTGVLALSGLCVLTVMRLCGWSWNLMSLMAVPLVLGTGVDYSIFMLLALKRFQGDAALAYRSVGRALLLCGGTAIAGFGSLAWSSNAGMASLGKVCATGIGCNMLIAIFLLPNWWLWLRKRVKKPSPEPQLSAPSALYGYYGWRAALWFAPRIPYRLCASLAMGFATLYWLFAAKRRKAVIENLLPGVDGDLVDARRKTRSLFQEFAIKLVQLWRYEAGLPIDTLAGSTTGFEHFTAAHARKRGVLLLTIHMGNWEFGGALVVRQGIPLQVLTMEEPGEGLTELRKASRARWNIETLVIGKNPLAFVEVIRRLETGSTVALLVDRPPPLTAVEVSLFGRPFAASIAAAELARASGCAIVPAYLVRKGTGFDAHILPEITYDRAQLKDRQARQVLTQQIMSVFEPVIQNHLDQWFHFVPIWPKTAPLQNQVKKLLVNPQTPG